MLKTQQAICKWLMLLFVVTGMPLGFPDVSVAHPDRSHLIKRPQGDPVYALIGSTTAPPSGFIQFCRDFPADCRTNSQEARDIILSRRAWNDLVALNDRVNQTVLPKTDIENYRSLEKWTYPDNGYGDCEDYILLKRKFLIEAGWPRSALLLTVVRDNAGGGHAVLMVKTDRGEFVLDNLERRILPWEKTGYQYVKRQSQFDQNVWVSLGNVQTNMTATEK